VLDDRHLEAQAEPEEGHVVLAGVPNRLDLPVRSAGAEPAGDDDGVGRREPLLVAIRGLVGVDPQHVHLRLGVDSGVFQRLVNRHVRVL